MGQGYIIGCKKCITEDDLDNILIVNEKVKGTSFDIFIGVGRFCSYKEKLEKIYGINKKNDRTYRLLAAGDPPKEIYKKIGTMTHKKDIDKIIYENIDNGFEFTGTLGSFPYYCESCKKLFSHFYFEMKKDNIIYTPKYICEKCSNVLGLSFLEWERNTNTKIDEDDKYKNIDIKYNISIENEIIKIKSNEEEKKLICEHCGNDQFSIVSSYMFD